MSASAIDLRTIVIGLLVQTPQLTTTIPLSGRRVTIIGKQTRVLDISMHTIEMLTRDCNPGEPITRPEAATEFQEATERLISDGTPFATVTRHGWNLPALEWSRP
jgi:hypothetical protein